MHFAVSAITYVSLIERQYYGTPEEGEEKAGFDFYFHSMRVLIANC